MTHVRRLDAVGTILARTALLRHEAAGGAPLEAIDNRLGYRAEQDLAGLEIVSRTELLRRAGKTTFTDPELEHQARQLSTAVDHLGG